MKSRGLPAGGADVLPLRLLERVNATGRKVAGCLRQILPNLYFPLLVSSAHTNIVPTACSNSFEPPDPSPWCALKTWFPRLWSSFRSGARPGSPAPASLVPGTPRKSLARAVISVAGTGRHDCNHTLAVLREAITSINNQADVGPDVPLNRVGLLCLAVAGPRTSSLQHPGAA